MKEFYKWWKKASQGGINEYHAYEGWKAALKWIEGINDNEAYNEAYNAAYNAVDQAIYEELNVTKK